MQVGAVLVFEAGPLALRSGGIDVERIRAYTAERLRAEPLVAADPHFDADYLVRHVALPRPGDERQLKRLAARLLGPALDPERAPFELWLVEGLDDSRFALVAKADAEECRDAEILTALLGDARRGKARSAPRAAPEASRLGLLRRGVNTLERALASDAGAPLAGAGGPHRRVDWLELDLASLRARCEVLLATPRELVLAALAGALRAFLERRGHEPDALSLRASVPPLAELVPLPVAEPEPRARIAALRASLASAAADEPERASADPLRALARAHAAVTEARPSDLAIADLAADPGAGSLLGAPLRACIPLPALPAGHTLGIATTRCDGRVIIGVSGDAARVPDLALFADAVAAAFEALRLPEAARIHVDSTCADGQPLRSYEAEA